MTHDPIPIFDYASPRNRHPRLLIPRWALTLLGIAAAIVLPWLVPFVLMLLAACLQAIFA